MNAKTILMALCAVAAAAGGGYALYRAGVEAGMSAAPPAHADHAAAPAPSGAAATGSADPASGRRVLYWHDPMVPGPRFDKPGKSPFMDMQLVPVYAEPGADPAGVGAGVAIDARVRQNLGVRVEEVSRGSLDAGIDAVGGVAYDERAVAVVQARSNGFVERVHVRAPLEPVRAGQPLVDLYVPDWVAAQEEFLSVRRMAAASGEPPLLRLVDAARQRMRLAGMDDAAIGRVEAGGAVQTRTTLTAPIGGVVGEVSVREGMTVAAGAPLYRINGLGTVWINAEVPERVAARVRPGQAVEVRTAAGADVLRGKVAALLPEINSTTRTTKARIEIANPGGRLVPGMFASVRILDAGARDVLLVPTEALIPTGERTVVIVAQPDGRFAPADVETGAERGGRTEIRRGLAAGQKVVVSGQFLVDSEASLRGALSRMGADPAPAPAAPATPTAPPKAAP